MWQIRGGAQQQFLDLLSNAHSYGTTVRSWYNGEMVGELSTGPDAFVESGQVAVTGLNRLRRTLTLIAAETLMPKKAGDFFSAWGNWLSVVAVVSSGGTIFDEIPIFAGKVIKPRRVKTSGQMSVTAYDPMFQINKEPFEAIRPAQSGVAIPAMIATLIQEVFPDANITDLTGSTIAVPDSTAWDAQAESRGMAIDALAASIGAEVYALPTQVWPGGDFVIRPIPSLNDPVAWTLPASPAIVESDTDEQSCEELVNRWVVLVERADQTPLYVPATDDDPSSPTRYGGPMGRLADFMSSPYIQDAGQGLQAGLARLRRSVGLADARTLSIIGNPALDAGDVLAIPGDDTDPTAYHIADEFTLQLTADPPSMDVNCRSINGGTP